jgi:stage V sporulation protein S
VPPETDEEIVVLRVSSKSDPQAVATAIFKSIFDSNKFPNVRAIGHGAVGQAVKAIAIARGHTAQKGVDLACNIGFETIKNAEGEEISAMVFKTFAR